MKEKLRNSMILILSLFLVGSLITFIGLSKGYDFASSLSRPIGANSWTISNEMVLACTYTPVIIGASLIILSIILSTVLFINWLNK